MLNKANHVRPVKGAPRRARERWEISG